MLKAEDEHREVQWLQRNKYVPKQRMIDLKRQLKDKEVGVYPGDVEI